MEGVILHFPLSEHILVKPTNPLCEILQSGNITIDFIAWKNLITILLAAYVLKMVT